MPRFQCIEPRPEFGGDLRDSGKQLLEQRQALERHAAGERAAAKRAPMRMKGQVPCGLFREKRGAERQAGSQRLCGDHEIRTDGGPLISEIFPGAAQPGLRFIDHQECAGGLGQVARPAQETALERMNSSLTQDGLKDHGGGFPGYGAFQRRIIVGRDERDRRAERFERAPQLRLTGERQGRVCPAVKGTPQRDQVRLGWLQGQPASAHRLERRFHRFGSAVAEEGAIQSGDPAEALGQLSLVTVVDKVRSMHAARGLLDQGCRDPRMRIAKGIDTDAGHHVEITPAGGVVHVAAAPGFHYERVAVVNGKEIVFAHGAQSKAATLDMSNMKDTGDRYTLHMETPDLRQLRYFVAVAEELHFGRAAERIGIAQPPLTQQIQKLEARLGCRLLDRGRKTRLTEAGGALLGETRRILAQVERAVEVTRRAARGETGQLRIGAPPSVLLTALPGAIRKYRRLYPNVQFTLRELSTSAIEDAIRRSELDLGFLRETLPEAPLVSRVVLEEPVVAVLPASHPLAARKRLVLASLGSEPFVFFPRPLGPAFYDKLVGFCMAAGFVPRVIQEATQWQTVVSFVEAGMGVSLAPGCVRRFRWEGVVYRRLARLSTVVSTCWRRDGAPSTAGTFFKLAKAELSQACG
jgi:DNA-binding transcriptional LysR family regulator